MKRLFVAASCLLLALSCAGPEDNPTNVKDLRVLGISFEPPELMASSCEFLRNPQGLDVSQVIVFAQPVQMRALIADPAGEGRDISYDIRACAWPGDRKCEREFDSAELARGTTKEGELVVTLQPGATLLPKRRLEDFTGADGGSTPQPLLLQVFEQDIYKGLGGLRMPVMLHLKAGDEEIFAQKLMVFSCKLFPEQQANINPVLPGVFLEDAGWSETDVRELSGDGPFKMNPEDFAARQEHYVVPSFELSPVELDESWKLAWHATFGRIAPGETGGTDLDGVESRHNTEWTLPSVKEAKAVTFYVVVRDGRGGTAWIKRSVNYTP